jgi:hypothetical protein
MPKTEKPSDKETPKDSSKKAKKPKYEPPKLEKFGALEKLIVSGE